MLHMSLCYPVQGNKNNTNCFGQLDQAPATLFSQQQQQEQLHHHLQQQQQQQQVLTVPSKVYPATTGTLDGQPTYRSLSLTQVSIVWSLT